MSEIRRLIRVTRDRNRAEEYTSVRVRLLKTDLVAMKAQLKIDGLSPVVLFEAVVRGYIDRHPSVLAMVDQWIRDSGREPVSNTKNISQRELDEILTDLGSAAMTEED